jgi:hypothetical protein
MPGNLQAVAWGFVGSMRRLRQWLRVLGAYPGAILLTPHYFGTQVDAQDLFRYVAFCMRSKRSCSPGVQLAERTITDDLEFLIAHTVDPRGADYAGGAAGCLAGLLCRRAWPSSKKGDSNPMC